MTLNRADQKFRADFTPHKVASDFGECQLLH